MSYFAKSKCPHCGEIEQFHLGGDIWASKTKPYMTGKCVTVCKHCGKEYDPQENCIECHKDDDYPERPPKVIEDKNEVILDAAFINKVTGNDIKIKVEAVIKYLDKCARMHLYSNSKNGIVIISDEELNCLREEKILKKVKDIFRDERRVDLKYIGESCGGYHLVLDPIEEE